MRLSIPALATLLLTMNLQGCADDGSDPIPSCNEQIDAYGECIDEFCAGEGSGSIYCDCWRRHYSVTTEGCACQTQPWQVGQRGLCSNIGPDAFSEQIDCESGLDFARRWIADCG